MQNYIYIDTMADEIVVAQQKVSNDLCVFSFEYVFFYRAIEV